MLQIPRNLSSKLLPLLPATYSLSLIKKDVGTEVIDLSQAFAPNETLTKNPRSSVTIEWPRSALIPSLQSHIRLIEKHAK